MITLSSPAKINLFLRVLRRRPDAYHELATLLQTIDLCDTLRISLSATDQFTCDDPAVPTDHTNLAVRALNLFREKMGRSESFTIDLQKRIPMEAGLGGGSSNAATTLFAINHLLEKPASTTQLRSLAAEIGSDVPFFLTEGTAYCTGRGETVRSLPSLGMQTLWIVKPKEGLSTPSVYGSLEIEQLEKRDPEVWLDGWLQGKAGYFNDLETPAYQTLPSLALLRDSLVDQGFSQVLLSGSGSSIFCIGKDTPPRVEAACYRCQFMRRQSMSWYGGIS